MQVKKALAHFNKIINDSNGNTYDSVDKLFEEENNLQEMLTPEPTSNFPNLEYIVNEGIQNRFDINICKHEFEIAKKELIVASKNKIPDLQIGGGYAYLPGRDTKSGNLEHGAYVGANIVNIPLLYNFSPEIKNASLKIKQAQYSLESTKNKAIKDISSAYESFLTAAENLN